MDTVSGFCYTAEAYYRLSREDGDKIESDSISNQRALIQEFLAMHPNISLYKEQVDDGYSGIRFDRPAFQEMLVDIQSGVVNCILVKDLSRLGRDYIETGRYIEKIFPSLGVRFIAVTDGIDTAYSDNRFDDLLIPFKNLMNEAYCRDISIKIRSHLDIKRKTGQFIGSFAPFGYKKSCEDKNHLEIDTDSADIVKKIFRWRLEGMSSLRIAQRLNEDNILTPMHYKLQKNENYTSGFRKKEKLLWHANSVNVILKNECYTGVLLQGKTFSPSYKIQKRMKCAESRWFRYENSHSAIISREDFLAVNASFAQDTRVSPAMETLHLFSGFAVCAYCQGTMTRKIIPANGKKYSYLTCVEHKNKNGCANRTHFSIARLESILLQIINAQIYMGLTLFQKFSICERIDCTALSRVFLSALLRTIQIYNKDRIEIHFLFCPAWNSLYVQSLEGERIDG